MLGYINFLKQLTFPLEGGLKGLTMAHQEVRPPWESLPSNSLSPPTHFRVGGTLVPTALTTPTVEAFFNHPVHEGKGAGGSPFGLFAH